MFVTSHSLLLAVFNVLALFTALSLAAPAPASHHSFKHGRGVRTGVLEKRGGNTRFTYYDAGQNACGSYDSNTAYVIALSPSMFSNGAHCNKPVTVQYNGQRVQATVTDECPGCNDGQADLSRPLFAHLAPLDEGVIYGDWWFN